MDTLLVARLVLMSTMFLTSIGYGVILPTLPFLAEKLGATAFQMGLAMSMFALSQIFASSIWGSLSDRIGKKPVLIIGVVGYGAVSSILPFSPNVAVLIVIRFVAGIMASAVMPSSLALAAESSTSEDRPRIIGYMGSVNGIGFICGPAVGAFLSVFGLSVPFVSVGILAIINGLLAMRLLPRALKDGSIEYKRRDVQLSVVQRLKLSLFNRMIAPLLLGTFIIALVDSSISVTLAYFITGPLQSTQTMAGWAFTTNAGVSVLAQILMFSRVFQRLGDTLTIVVGFSFSAVGYFLLGTSKYLVMVFCGLGLVSFGRGFARPAVSTGISLRSPKELQGSSFGVQSTISSFGRTIGPLIAGWLFGHYERDPYYFSAGLLLLTIGFYLVWMSRMRKTVRSASQTDDVRETIS